MPESQRPPPAATPVRITGERKTRPWGESGKKGRRSNRGRRTAGPARQQGDAGGDPRPRSGAYRQAVAGNCEKSKGPGAQQTRQGFPVRGVPQVHSGQRHPFLADQQLGCRHAVSDRMGRLIEGELVAQTPGEDARAQQHQREGESAQQRPVTACKMGFD